MRDLPHDLGEELVLRRALLLELVKRAKDLIRRLDIVLGQNPNGLLDERLCLLKLDLHSRAFEPRLDALVRHERVAPRRH